MQSALAGGQVSLTHIRAERSVSDRNVVIGNLLANLGFIFRVFYIWTFITNIWNPPSPRERCKVFLKHLYENWFGCVGMLVKPSICRMRSCFKKIK